MVRRREGQEAMCREGLKIRPEYVGHIAQPEIPLFTPVGGGRGEEGGGADRPRMCYSYIGEEARGGEEQEMRTGAEGFFPFIL